MPFDGTNLSETVNLLLAQRAQIESGWCQHAIRKRGWEFYTAEKGFGLQYRVQVCMMGVDYARQTEALLVKAAMDLGYEIGALGLPGFNDERGRTKKQVLAVYDRAIEMSLYVESTAPLLVAA